MSEQTKICTGCNETKDISCFYNNKNNPDGLCSRCKDCSNAADKAYREANKEKVVARKKDYYKANKDKMRARAKAHHQSQHGKYKSYKSSAKQRNLLFDLTFDEFMTFWQADCGYCGDPISTIGIDRINSSVGYTLVNCVSCCTRCNIIKLDYDIEETDAHMIKMLRHRGII